MKILGVDASLSSTGWSVFENGKVTDYGKICTKRKNFDNDIERISYICRSIEDLFEFHYDIEVCVLENSIPAKHSQSVTQLNFLKGMIIKTMQNFDVDVELMYPSTVKKLVAGKGTAPKEEVARYIQGNIKDVGEYYDGASVKKKTSDIYDSMALVVAYLKEDANEKE